MTRALLYHDVVPEGDYSSSGFVTPDANIYKFSTAEFEHHLAAIASRKATCQLTFDDGGVAAIRWTADMIERFGYHGYFFITTDFIGKPGFLSPSEIAELSRRGHFIGSHSCSHPVMMARCPAEQLEHEWRDSIAKLSDILGMPVTSASVPGGSYSRQGRASGRKGWHPEFIYVGANCNYWKY